MSWVEKLREYGVTIDEVKSWAAENYPEYSANIELMAKLYLAIKKGIRVAKPKIVGEFKKVSDLTVAEVSRIKVVVIQKVDLRRYAGCPKCYRKLNAAPDSVVDCPYCGTVKVAALAWSLFLAGDDTGEIILAFPPSVGDNPREGEVIAVEGVLSETEEFIVYRWSPYSEASTPVKQPAKPSAPVPVVEFKQPPSAAEIFAKAQSQVAQPTPEEAKPFTCSSCGKTFKTYPVLMAHYKSAHPELYEAEKAKKATVKEPVKTPGVEPIEAYGESEVTVEEHAEEAKAVALPAAPTPPPPVSPQEETGDLDDLVRFCRVAATLNKPYDDFKSFLFKRYPNITEEHIMRALEQAGAEVRDGKVVKKG